MKVIIVGAGAAGCFAAITLKRLRPDAEVAVLEAGSKALAKVAITGGGRCNLTNSFREVRSLEQVYPRGHRLLKRLFHHFSHTDAFQWFEQEGVALVTQSDECVFPQSQDAMQIVHTLTGLMHRLGVRLLTRTRVTRIEACEEGGYLLQTTSNAGQSAADSTPQIRNFKADKVLVAMGGKPQLKGFDLLEGLQLEVVPPVPSLFSLCIDNESLRSLMGTVVTDAGISLSGTKMKTQGALLITHWGISGPATLRLSSSAARVLAEQSYKGEVCINWMASLSHDEVWDHLRQLARQNAARQVNSVHHPSLNARLWLHLLGRAGISPQARWNGLSEKELRRLHSTLTGDMYRVVGKNRFKEEFVTCGGVALSNLNPSTLECKQHPGLYFAGEATDVDAYTGGFNLQAAWTMGYVAAQSIAAE